MSDRNLNVGQMNSFNSIAEPDIDSSLAGLLDPHDERIQAQISPGPHNKARALDAAALIQQILLLDAKIVLKLLLLLQNDFEVV